MKRLVIWLTLLLCLCGTALCETITVGDHEIEATATAFSTLHSANAKRHTAEELEGLKYCKNLIALDLGHNKLDDLSFLTDMTQLKILILADCGIRDITPLASLTNLEYLELFGNDITDISALSGLENLKDLELSINQIADFSPLYGLKLERLKLQNAGKKIPRKELDGALADCQIDYYADPAQGKWREHSRYFDIYTMFQTGEYFPWTDKGDEK